MSIVDGLGAPFLSYPAPSVTGMKTEPFPTDVLQTLPAGPELAARLAALDRSTFTRDDAISVLQARLRLKAHVEGELLRDMIDVAHLESALGSKRSSKPIEFSEVEIATALSWTKRAAMRQLQLALDLKQRLPNVLEALCAGTIDYPKVLVFADVTTPVETVAEARRIVDLVLPLASEMNTTRIRVRLRKLIEEVDPDAAKRRAETSAKSRRVHSGPDSNGTAWLSALGLPIEKAAAAMERVDAMARAARNGGDPRTLAQLRADVAVDLVIGSYDGPSPIHRKGVVELTVPLTTLMKLTDLPGELVGWAPICADIARQTAEQMRADAAYTFVVHDTEGGVIAAGATRKRPPAPAEAVLGRGPDGAGKPTAERKASGPHNTRKAAVQRLEDDPVPDEPAGRRPTKTMAAYVRARVTQCIFPGCNEPSSRCQLDHAQRWADGGDTTVQNLHPICQPHHRVKDEGGWTYRELRAAVYEWTSTTGRHYLVDRRRFRQQG